VGKGAVGRSGLIGLNGLTGRLVAWPGKWSMRQIPFLLGYSLVAGWLGWSGSLISLTGLSSLGGRMV
jgi:hypothetical protein